MGTAGGRENMMQEDIGPGKHKTEKIKKLALALRKRVLRYIFAHKSFCQREMESVKKEKRHVETAQSERLCWLNAILAAQVKALSENKTVKKLGEDGK